MYIPHVIYAELDVAIRFAAQAHSMSERDGENPLPYVTHPILVLEAVRNIGGVTDEAILVAAVLHDAVEDTDRTLDEIRSRFGERVARIVHQLTRTEPDALQVEGLDKDEIWAVRSAMLLSDIASMGREAQTIKLADRLCNLRDAVRIKDGRKMERYLKQTDRILELIPRPVNVPLWDALATDLTAIQKNLAQAHG